jgi:hypothetical protein
LLTGSGPPEPLYVEPGREVCTGVKVAGALTVDAVEIVLVTVVVEVTVDLK